MAFQVFLVKIRIGKHQRKFKNVGFQAYFIRSLPIQFILLSTLILEIQLKLD